MSRAQRRAAVGVGGVALLATVALALGGGGATPATAADQSGADQASALTTAALPVRGASVVYPPGAPAERRAAELAGQVPLPPGEAFDDLDWNNGELTDLDIQGLLEMNAACKWWIANADRPSAESAEVVAAIPSWPTMRDGERHRIVAALAEPKPSEFAVQVLAACRTAVR